jgi:hypothetical protein
LAVIVSVSAVLRRIVVRREVARDWPIFADDSEVPAAVGVTSVEVRRRVDESVASAAVVSATALGAAPELPGRDAAARPGKNLAGGSGEADSPSSRIAVYLAKRDKLWAALEKAGVALPDGSRTETEITHSDDVLRFGGAIELTSTELPMALEVTRCENAVCVGRIDGTAGIDWERFLSSSDTFSEDPVGLLRLVLHQVSGGMFADRSFGQFDDAVVTSEDRKPSPRMTF